MSSTATQNSLLLEKSVVKLSPAGLRTAWFADQQDYDLAIDRNGNCCISINNATVHMDGCSFVRRDVLHSYGRCHHRAAQIYHTQIL